MNPRNSATCTQRMEQIASMIGRANEFLEKEAKERRKVQDSFAAKMAIIEDKKDPLLTEIYASLEAYVSGNEENLIAVIDGLESSVKEWILKSYEFFSHATNMKNKLRRTAEYIRKNYEEHEIVNYICEFGTKAVCHDREKLMWKALELKKNAQDPMFTFDEKPEDTVTDDEVMKQCAKQTIRLLKKHLPRVEGEQIVIRVAMQHTYLMIGVLRVAKTALDIGGTGYKFTFWTGAYNPKFPYICVHGVPSNEDLNTLAKILPGDYQIAHDLVLEDEGLTAVYSSLLKVPSALLKQTEDFRHRLEKYEQELSAPPLRPFPLPPPGKVKAARELECLINDGQDEGFKTLTLEYHRDECPIPIVCTMKAESGSLDEHMARLFKEGTWTDPTSYLEAKDRKTNLVKLKYDRAKEAWVSASQSSGSNSS